MVPVLESLSSNVERRLSVFIQNIDISSPVEEISQPLYLPVMICGREYMKG
jgi:hypothetical protein